jgi:hypothetical protein
MIDAVQAQLFAAVGRERSPFRDIAKWPWFHARLEAQNVAEPISDEAENVLRDITRETSRNTRPGTTW